MPGHLLQGGLQRPVPCLWARQGPLCRLHRFRSAEHICLTVRAEQAGAPQPPSRPAAPPRRPQPNQGPPQPPHSQNAGPPQRAPAQSNGRPAQPPSQDGGRPQGGLSQGPAPPQRPSQQGPQASGRDQARPGPSRGPPRGPPSQSWEPSQAQRQGSDSSSAPARPQQGPPDRSSAQRGPPRPPSQNGPPERPFSQRGPPRGYSQDGPPRSQSQNGPFRELSQNGGPGPRGQRDASRGPARDSNRRPQTPFSGSRQGGPAQQQLPFSGSSRGMPFSGSRQGGQQQGSRRPDDWNLPSIDEEEDGDDVEFEDAVRVVVKPTEPAHGMFPGVKGIKANKEIEAADVRLLAADRSMIGILSMKDALQRATDEEADVILVSADTAPPVCRLIAIDKFKYEQARVEKDAKRKQRESRQDLKELKIRPSTDVHDYQVRLRSAEKFLSKGDKVKVTLQFKGREISMKDSANEMMRRFITDLGDQAIVQQEPVMQGRALIMVLGPNKK